METVLPEGVGGKAGKFSYSVFCYAASALDVLLPYSCCSPLVPKVDYEFLVTNMEKAESFICMILVLFPSGVQL